MHIRGNTTVGLQDLISLKHQFDTYIVYSDGMSGSHGFNQFDPYTEYNDWTSGSHGFK